MRLAGFAVLVLGVLAAPLAGQAIPDNAHKVPWGKGWQCNQGYLERGAKCVSLGAASDSEIRQHLIRQSLASYSGSCPCPYNTDRAGRRCGRRSAYSRPGGASPICYARQISDQQVARIRARYQTKEDTLPDEH